MKPVPALLICLVAIRVSADTLVRYDNIHHPVMADAGMVVTQNAVASDIGVRILEQGGNAADASVAVGFALAVTLPRAGNIGGSGYSLVYDAGSSEVTAFDFRSAAPGGIDIAALTDNSGKVDTGRFRMGPGSPAVPGTVAGLHMLWKKHGSLEWRQLIAPSIRLAEKGIVVTDDLAYALTGAAPRLEQFPSSKDVYLPHGQAPVAGSLFRQPDLARSLRLIQTEGPGALYRGAIAKQIVSALKKEGGYIKAGDLEGYRVRQREPVNTHYRGYQVVTIPPSSSGGITLLQMLNILSHFDLASHPQGSAASIHLLAEAMKRAAANRRTYVGDPDFVRVPIRAYTSMAVAKELAAQIPMSRATPVAEITAANLRYQPEPESRDTTHFSVVDRWGNGVSTTYTLGSSFGSGYVVPGTGILLDDQMKNFYWNSGGHPNRYEPGKRMISTMTPTLLLDANRRLSLVTGTPGGGRIVNVILQIIINVVDYDMNIAAATQAPRIHQGWRSGVLAVEKLMSPDTVARLKSLGHEVEWQQTMGSTQSIAVHANHLAGAADTRRPGADAAGQLHAPSPSL